MKVYLLFVGDYDESDVVAVFSTREAAEQASEAYSEHVSKCVIEKTVDYHHGQKPFMKLWNVQINEGTGNEYAAKVDPSIYKEEYVFLGGTANCYTWDTDKESAIEYVRDRLRQFQYVENGIAHDEDQL